MNPHRTKIGFAAVLAIAASLSLAAISSRADDWPQWRGPQRDGVWRETGLIERFSSDKLTPKWRAEIASGYSGPTVADGRVFITDRIVEPEQKERVHCFDEKTGEPVWSYEYPRQYRVGYTAGPRASVTVDGNRAYALGAMGDLHCFEAATGKVLWKRDLLVDYKIRMPIWGIAAAPLIEDDMIILQIGGQGACIVALDKKSGRERWTSLNDRAQYAAPIVVEQGKQRVVIFWTGDNVVGLDPKSGKPFWQVRFKPTRMPIGIATPVALGNRLFMTSFYDGSLMLSLDGQSPAISEVWRRRGRNEHNTDALHSIIATPLLIGDHIYGVDSHGELRCLESKTGDRVWESTKPTPRARWSNIHMVQNGDKTWMFNERGELIIAQLSPKGYEEISRAKLIEPTTDQLRQRGGVCWAHPAYANRHIFVRNDKEIICASLAAQR